MNLYQSVEQCVCVVLSPQVAKFYVSELVRERYVEKLWRGLY